MVGVGWRKMGAQGCMRISAADLERLPRFAAPDSLAAVRIWRLFETSASASGPVAPQLAAHRHGQRLISQHPPIATNLCCHLSVSLSLCSVVVVAVLLSTLQARSRRRPVSRLLRRLF